MYLKKYINMRVFNLIINSRGLYFINKYGENMSYSEAVIKIINRVKNIYYDMNLYIVHIISTHVPFYTIRKLIFTLNGVKIRHGSVIHMGCRFFYLKGIEIGKDSIVGYRAFLDGRDRLKIGDHVDIASEVMIYNSEHDINDQKFKAKDSAVEVGDYVFIGPRAIILPGVKIGKGAVVAAGCVVTKDVPEYAIYAGVPGRVIGERKIKDLNYILGRTRLFQ